MAPSFSAALLPALLPMAGFAFATSASPGPVNIILAMSGARFGARKTIPYALGATLSFVSILALAGLGLAHVMTSVPRLKDVLTVLGSLYMLYLAWRLARASLADPGRYPNDVPPGLIAGAIAQYANPKAWIVAISAIAIYVATSAH